jgi:monoamine oxidase
MTRKVSSSSPPRVALKSAEAPQPQKSPATADAAAPASAQVDTFKTNGVAATNGVATKQDLRTAFDVGKMAYESAQTVLGNRAQGNIAAQLERIKALDKGPRKTITILGAGMAGLAAAYELEKLGHHVRILEGNDRLGGRVLTHHFADGTYHELGAMRIPASHDYTRHYVEELGLKLRKFVTSGEDPNAYFDIDGVETPVKDAAQTIYPRFNLSAEDLKTKQPGEILGKLMSNLAASLTPEEKKSLYSTTLSTERLRKLDHMTLREYLQKYEGPDAIQLIGLATGLDAEYDRPMTVHLRDELRKNGDGLEEIVGGMDQLPKGLAARVKGPIEFGTKVLGIRNLDDGKVELTISKNGGPPTKEIDDEVLTTLPLSVMRGMDLPTFSRGKQRAIHEMAYGSATKVLLDTKERVWESKYNIHGGASHSDGITGATYYPSDNIAADPKVSAGPGTLVGSYVWGQDARRLGAMAPDDREKAVIADVARFYPEIAEPGMVKDYATMSWDNNPWSAGAYGLPMPDQHPLYKEAIKREGNVHFAGEATSLDPGWIQGALISTLRAVEEIVTEKPGAETAAPDTAKPEAAKP